ncbi:MAG: transcriptional repressor [Kouleothrix sp.]|nr:transcriptional repressor [Kouleothrix sp.]
MSHSDDAAALRQQGHRLTPQRLMVLNVVKTSGRHLTAEDVHAAIVPQHPYINITTIYRTLQWLQEVGLVAPIAIGSGPLRYEYVHGGIHHHLVCQDCGYEEEIGDDILDALKVRLLERYAFTAQLNHLAIPGRCAMCQHTTSNDAPPAQEHEP